MDTLVNPQKSSGSGFAKPTTASAATAYFCHPRAKCERETSFNSCEYGRENITAPAGYHRRRCHRWGFHQLLNANLLEEEISFPVIHLGRVFVCSAISYELVKANIS